MKGVQARGHHLQINICLPCPCEAVMALFLPKYKKRDVAGRHLGRHKIYSDIGISSIVERTRVPFP